MTIFRPIRVFFSVVPFVVDFLRDWRRHIFFGSPRRLTELQHRDRARRLTKRIADLGPAFIKGAQVLATREDILPLVYTRELKTLQDQVPPFPSAEAHRMISQELGRPLAEVFAEIDDEPIASASLGQVYRAIYQGRRVAVKVLRPDVREIIEADLRVVRLIVRLVHVFVDSHFVRSFWVILLEFQRIIRQEMDFTNEEANAARLRANFADDKDICIPNCHPELTRPGLVVFDFVDGVRVDDVAGLRRFGVTPKHLIDTMIRVYVRMAIQDGFIHADPHPGNLLVDKEGRINILDYGMAVEFEEKTKVELLRACFCMVQDDLDGLVSCLYRLKMIDPEINPAVARDAAQVLLAIQMREDFTPRLVQEIAEDILRTFHQFPLRMPQQLVYLFRAAALIEGLGMQYDPHFSGVREATPTVKELIRQFAFGKKRPIKDRAVEFLRQAWDTATATRRIVERLEREELRIHLHNSDARRLERFFTALLRRILYGLGAIAMGLWGVMIYGRTGNPWILFGTGIPSTVVFVLATIVPLRRRLPLGD